YRINAQSARECTRKVCLTPTDVGKLKYVTSRLSSGAPIIAPPPKPMMAIPVSIPRRSGNHFTSVDTGEIYPRPRPIPPITPPPSHMIQSWCTTTPIAAMTMPPHQHMAETTPALRGPARSSHPPHSAADDPRNTKKSVYIHPRSATRQSHV